jgi:hypothetical protein
VNCNQARVLLTAYRELKFDDILSAQLDDHLEHCPACREELAHSRFITEQLDTLPTLEPGTEFSTKVMQALAAEHAKYLQRSSAAIPPPEFLKPYISEYAQSSRQVDPLAVLSTADTGPLPLLTRIPKRRHSHMSQFAIIGLAAAFLMVIMMGGITSLLLLAQSHVSPQTSTASIIHPADIVASAYTTSTPYNHVMSAVADNNAVYYSAYGDGNNNAYMLERMDRFTKQSTPLLAAPSSSPLIVLGASNGWLVWLQFEPPKPLYHGNVPQTSTIIRTWSLHYLPVASLQSSDLTLPSVAPMTLLSGSFNQSTAPDWIFTPIQGIFFMQNTLLVASVDENGLSQLTSYLLVSGANASPPAKTIATTGPGYVITSPTATPDGTQIYWAEEWRGNDGLLHSNIWTQQTYNAPRSTHGIGVQQTTIVKEPFLQDGLSFHPAVVDNALFLLSTASAATLAQEQSQFQAEGTPELKATTPANTQIAADTTSSPNNTTPWANASIYTTPLDSELQGTILMYPLDDAPSSSPMQLSLVDQASALQAGNDFVLWQNSSGYNMYDAATHTDVTVGQTLDNAQFVAVNGNTTTWTDTNGSESGSVTNGANGLNPNPSATLKTFNWPRLEP